MLLQSIALWRKAGGRGVDAVRTDIAQLQLKLDGWSEEKGKMR